MSTPREVMADELRKRLVFDQAYRCADAIVKALEEAGFWIAPNEATPEIIQAIAWSQGITNEDAAKLYQVLHQSYMSENKVNNQS